MKRIIIALAVATSVVAGAASAQDQDNAARMGEGLSMLELAVDNELSRLGVDGVDAMSLSLGQLAEIRAVVGSDDWNNNEKKQQIDTIVNR